VTFHARFRGTCVDCREEIEVGDEVQFNLLDELIHVDCIDLGVADRKTETCSVCFLIKPCGCDDL